MTFRIVSANNWLLIKKRSFNMKILLIIQISTCNISEKMREKKFYSFPLKCFLTKLYI